MYPNLYYVFKDWFGVEWKPLSFLNTFGLMVAMGFVAAAWILTIELRRKEKQGLLLPREEMITVGKPATIFDLITNALLGFAFGYKFLGLFFSKPDMVSPQEYIFSNQGNLIGGIIIALLMAGMKWWDKNKHKLKEPERRVVRIWPHDRVGDIIIMGLVFGILGAKLFDNLEHWDEFWANPIERLLSQSGLTFYGGLILASIAICWYAVNKSIKLKHLVDAAAPALMIAYAIGRIGCQVSGDGDWGIYNSAYISDNTGKVVLANKDDFQKMLNTDSTYFLKGEVWENEDSRRIYVTDRTYPSLASVPHQSIKAPSFLPVWFFAYSYPQNVNKDGISMPGITDEHNRVLPSPVFPTPLYETLICTILFFIMWFNRNRIKTPYLMFGLYLSLNGSERFLIEMMRVNRSYGSLKLTQAEIIALLLIASGLLLILIAKKTIKKVEIE
ncbi:MAG: prolipoprotein diacylglyceryl transferase family protein [Bacteroidota bacterium]